MKEHPILFSGPMVTAILESRKTQTRRVIKPQPEEVGFGADCEVRPYCTCTKWPLAYYERRGGCWNSSRPLKCPYGQAGDHLWVRETFFCDHPFFSDGNVHSVPKAEVLRQTWYRADEPSGWWEMPWSPSIHMPRFLSRLTLEVVNVRAERLQDISEADAEAEGVAFLRDIPDADETLSAKALFEILWDSINEKRGYGWSKNPWVWAVEFAIE